MKKFLEEEKQWPAIVVNLIIYSHWLVKMLDRWSEPLAIFFAVILTVITAIAAYNICQIILRLEKKLFPGKKRIDKENVE